MGKLNDETKWPSIQWPEIYNYLIDTPSVNTRDKLKAYKSLDAYNFVLCGHVQDIQFYDFQVQDFVVLKTEVLPSQRQCKKTELYKAWVIVNKTNNCILIANCNCMAGYVTKNHCLKILLFLFSISNLFKLKLFAEIIQLFLYL